MTHWCGAHLSSPQLILDPLVSTLSREHDNVPWNGARLPLATQTCCFCHALSEEPVLSPGDNIRTIYFTCFSRPNTAKQTMTLSAYIQPSDILEQEEDISIEVEYFYSLAWHTHFTTAHTFYHIATFDHIATESLYKPLSRQNTP